jgi:tetratricopeptide (TPR) repeat protein
VSDPGFLFDRVPIEPGDGAQPPGHDGTRPAPGFQIPGEALDVGAADGEQGKRPGAAPAGELAQVGSVYGATGQSDLAINCLNTAIAAFDRLDDPCAAQALRNLGEIYLAQCAFDQAAQQLKRALRTFEELGVLRGQAQVLLNLGTIARRLIRPGEARQLLTSSMELFEWVGDQESAQHARNELAAATS